MNNLKDFSDLTQFVHDEFLKIQQAYGFKQMSAKNIAKISNNILSAFNIVNAITKKKISYSAKIDWAIFTAPHSWLWRLFHRRLWQKCLEEIERRKQELEESLSEEDFSENITPEHKAVDLASMSLSSSVIDPTRSLLE